MHVLPAAGRFFKAFSLLTVDNHACRMAYYSKYPLISITWSDLRAHISSSVTPFFMQASMMR